MSEHDEISSDITSKFNLLGKIKEHTTNEGSIPLIKFVLCVGLCLCVCLTNGHVSWKACYFSAGGSRVEVEQQNLDMY